MSDETQEELEQGTLKDDGIFTIAFAWLAALATSVAGWFGLS
jgi:hypothetical protein